MVAGRDRSVGGTWLGVRDGVIAAVLNRPGSLGPAPGKRSRGELPLLALEHGTAAAAATALAALDAAQFRTFNMVVADRHGVVFLRGMGSGQPHAEALPPGFHMVTAHDPNDLASPRVARYLPRFRAAPVPDPDADEFSAWQTILADRSGPPGTELNVPDRGGFGTVCSSVLAVSQRGQVRWWFAAGQPDTAPFLPVALPAGPAA